MKHLVVLYLSLVPVSDLLASPGEYSGRVVTETGDPIAAATIEFGDQHASSNANGEFVVAGISGTPMVLRISAPGYYDAVQTFAPSSARPVNVGNIELVARAENRRLLLFAGDAMLARRYFEPRAEEPALARKGHELDDAKALLNVVAPYISAADFASVNLETQLADETPKERLPKSVTFFSPPELAQALEWAGFDYVALGNNHTWDYGASGLQTTFDALNNTTLAYSGAGFDEPAARAPHTTTLDGQRLSLLSYNGWPGTFTPTQTASGDKGGAALGGDAVFAEDLGKLQDDSISVLQYHSGLEYVESPAMSERQRLRHAIDHGADVAIGHHAHVLQGLEIYNNRLIAYSMGNFLFDQYIYSTQLGMLLYVWMDDDQLHRAEIVPMHVNGYVPTPATGSIRYSILHRLARLSRPLGTCLRSNGAHAVAESCDADREQSIDLSQIRPGNQPVHLDQLDASPLEPVAISTTGYQYRLGTDILRRGDFESVGLFGTQDRGWITNDNVAVVDTDSKQLRVVLGKKATRTGMKVFDRVFTPSNPTSLSGRIYVDRATEIRFYLQRRRIDQGFSEALDSGPLTSVGGLRVTEPGWHYFTLDFDQPRLATRGVRLLFDVTAKEPSDAPQEVRFDDLSWVEWKTPWLNSGSSDFATHVQFRPKP